MDRKEFIQKVGIGAAVALTIGCCGACTKMANPDPPVDSIDEPEPEPVDFTLDLTEPSNAALQNNGGYVIIDNKHVVGRDNSGQYWACTRLCSDQNLYGIVWGATENEWVCTEHNATFDTLGNGTTTYNNLGVKGIRTYNTQLNGNLLHVYS